MKVQISINLESNDLEALDTLAALEHRSRSEMGAIIIRQRLDQLRQEYRQDSSLPSLPKQRKDSLRCWDDECRELYG